MRPLSAALAPALLLLLVACGSGGRAPLPPPGAPPPQPAAPEAEPLSEFADLLLLPGRRTMIRYSPDTLDRATQMQRRLEAIAETLEKVQGGPLLLSGLVIDREAWTKLRPGGPYGLPARTGTLVFAIAAEPDPESVRIVRGLTGGWLPPLGGEPLRGTADEASSLAVADALLELDVASAFLDSHGVRGSEPWVEALLAQLVARVAWQVSDPGNVPAIADLYDRMAAAAPGPRPASLADYRRGLPRERDLAWQSTFLRGADAIWVDKGDYGCRRWLKKIVRIGAPVARAELEKEFPALVEWERASFAR
jgi:hypothetical protein